MTQAKSSNKLAPMFFRVSCPADEVPAVLKFFRSHGVISHTMSINSSTAILNFIYEDVILSLPNLEEELECFRLVMKLKGADILPTVSHGQILLTKS